MPVTLDLRENGHVIYLIITDPWSIQDVASLQGQNRAYLDASSHRVHTLVSIRSQHVPSGIFSARPSRPGLANPHSGQIVIVGAPTFLKVIAETMFKIAHYTRSSFFDTEEQVWTYLRHLITEENKENTTNEHI